MDGAAEPERDRLERERERNDRAEAERLREAGRRPVGENIEEGLRLIAFAQQFQAGFSGRGAESDGLDDLCRLELAHGADRD